ncbi:MAG: alcohol dehydrogenase catalytic domain-containing protein [Planctomycetota bacterium]|nr:alcohol dehydrogenase catalytic domain-containing protein [Planctomycetota bacterium]
MKALVLTGPRAMSLETVPDPAPAPHEAVVQVAFAGICGTDVELFVNEHLLHYKMGYARLPIVPGHEWTGTVVATGREVTNVKAGDPVIAEVALGCGACRFCRSGHYNVCPDRREVGIINQNGGFAQFACIPASNLRKAEGLDPAHAALAEPTAVTLNGCRKVNVAYPDRVLVIGAGPIGLLSLQCARACGAQSVTVLDRDPARLALAKKLGADEVLDASAFSPAELPERAKAVTAGEGFDVALECAGAAAVFEHLPLALARLGRVSVVGCFGEHHPRINPDLLIAGERMIVGAVGGGSSYADAVNLLRAGKVRAPEVVTHKLPLAQGPELLAALSERRGPAGALKILMQP